MSQEDFEVGDRVQKSDQHKEPITGGVVEKVVPPLKVKTKNYWQLTANQQEEMETHYQIKWDDGKVEVLQQYCFVQEDTELERSFRNTYNTTLLVINQKIEEAENLLKEAIDIAEENGVPFDSSVSSIFQAYTACSMTKKWEGIAHDRVEELTGISVDEYGGWRHSAVCS